MTDSSRYGQSVISQLIPVSTQWTEYPNSTWMPSIKKDLPYTHPYPGILMRTISARLLRTKSPLRDGFNTFLSISGHKHDYKLSNTELDIDLTCTNGTLPEQLDIGDICVNQQSRNLLNLRISSRLHPPSVPIIRTIVNGGFCRAFC